MSQPVPAAAPLLEIDRLKVHFPIFKGTILRRTTGRLHPRLTERMMDFDRLDTIEIPKGAHVYCAIGTTSVTGALPASKNAAG